jgi:hypothetical protein
MSPEAIGDLRRKLSRKQYGGDQREILKKIARRSSFDMTDGQLTSSGQ